MQRPRAGRAIGVVLTLLATAALATACAATGSASGGAAPASPVPTPNPLAAGGLQDPSRDAEWIGDDAVPVAVRIPSIGVESGLESLGLQADGALEPPVDYQSAGWFSDGVVPGAIGPAIVAGHIDSPAGPAVFARLAELSPGTDVVVDLSDGRSLTFDVTGSQQTAKAQFPTSDVYSTVPRPELRLITCAGTFDSATSHYLDNLIVYATLAG